MSESRVLQQGLTVPKSTEDLRERTTREAMRKTKILYEGQPCRKCGYPVVKQSHDKPSKPKQKYWFRYWFYCKKCKTFYMVEEAKVWIEKGL